MSRVAGLAGLLASVLVLCACSHSAGSATDKQTQAATKATANSGSEHKASPAARYMHDPAALKRGEMIYVGTCGGYCHSKGPRDAPNLFDCQWLQGGSDAQIFHTISYGVKGTRMIGFKGKLPNGDKDIWKIVAYLKTNRHCAQHT